MMKLRYKGGILNWKKTSWRGNLLQTIAEQLVQKPQSFSEQSFTQTWQTTRKMEWQKVIEVVIGLRDGFVHASAVVVWTLASVTCQDGKWKIDGKLRENLENICGMQFFFLVFFSFWIVCAYPKLKQQQKYVLGKDCLCSCKRKKLRLWGNPSLILRKSDTDFEENQSPTLGKSTTDFEEIRYRFWGNLSPTLGKSVTDFGKKTALT